MKEVWILLFLFWNSWTDFRRREISLSSFILFLCGGGLSYLTGDFPWSYMQLLGLIPGGILLLWGLLTEGKIGLGDGLVVLAVGVFLPVEDVITVITAAFAGAAFYAAVQFMRNRQKGNQSFPFIPFLFTGYVGGLWIWFS